MDKLLENGLLFGILILLNQSVVIFKLGLLLNPVITIIMLNFITNVSTNKQKDLGIWNDSNLDFICI